MNIQLSTPNDELLNSFATHWLAWAIFYDAILFVFLHTILTRNDFDTLNKILWVIVVIFAPLFGAVLYLIAAPKSVAATRPRMIPGSDVSGTPWADDPTYTKSP